MEIGKLNWSDIQQMPVDELNKYLEWKKKFDEEAAKMKEEYMKVQTKKSKF